MNLYFISEYPCAVKLNGVYYTTVFQEIKPIKVDCVPFIEVCAVNGQEQNINFFPDDDFFDKPPTNVCVTDLKGGYLLKFTKNFNNNGFNVIGQQKFNDCIVTLFTENGYKLTIETPYDFFAEEITFEVTGLKAEKVYFSNTNFIIVTLIGKSKYVMLFTVTNKVNKVFEREVDDYKVSSCLTTTENLMDIAKHKVTISWEFIDKKIKETNREITTGDSYDINKLNEKILPFAFLEEFLIGGNVKDFLCDDIKDKASSLSSYLGPYIGIMPPPLFRSENEIGLIYYKDRNKYYVVYYSFDIKERRIINIKCSE